MKLGRGRAKLIASLFYCLIVLGAIFFGSKITLAADDHLVIDEIYPNPDPGSCDLDWCEREWIELYNPTDQLVDLTGLALVDDEQSSTPVTLEKYLLMPANSYLVLTGGTDFAFQLSNSGEKIVLQKGDVIVDQFSYGTINGAEQSYPTSIKGQSYAFFGANGWKLTATPTPGETNVMTEKNSTNSPNSEPVDIALAREEPNGTAITITGTVTVTPNTLSSQYFYIQDNTGGLQIYSYYKNFPELKVGDEIKVSGELSEVSGERRLKLSVDSIITLLSHEAPLLPEKVEIRDIGENLEGRYAKVCGTVAETSGDTFVVEDAEKHQIKVVIKSMTNIEKPKMHQGDQVEVAGIVSQYKDDYRILPISQNDVKILSDPLPVAGPENYLPVLFASITIILWKSFQKAKTRLISLLRRWQMPLCRVR